MTLFFFFSFIILFSLSALLKVGGGGGVWPVGKCHSSSVAECPPPSHLLSVAGELFVFCDSVSGSGLPQDLPLGEITPVSHSLGRCVLGYRHVWKG